MSRKVYFVVLLGVLAISLSGCVSSRVAREKDMENQGLRNQISALDAQIQSKNQEINGLKEELNRQSEQRNQAAVESVKGKTSVKVTSHPTTKQVQTALMNAGFYTGNIDGHMGKKTREALRAFQKAHNLPVNGKANKKTWAELKESLTEKTK